VLNLWVIESSGERLQNVYGDFKKLNPDTAPHMTTITPLDDKKVIPSKLRTL
jgi:hypothetical protein